MKRLVRSLSFVLAFTACVALVGHADVHEGCQGSAVNCHMCHNAVYTAPATHVPVPHFYEHSAPAQPNWINWQPSAVFVDLTRGPPAA